MASATINRLIVNSPYKEPARHWRYDRTTRLFDLAAGQWHSDSCIGSEAICPVTGNQLQCRAFRCTNAVFHEALDKLPAICMLFLNSSGNRPWIRESPT